MTRSMKRTSLLLRLLPLVLVSGCVWLKQSEYDDMVAKDRRQQEQIAADQAQIDRLTGAIRYTVNSNLLFPSGGWQLSAAGQDIIAKMTSQLAEGQRSKLVVHGYTDDRPVGASLRRQGVASNQELSEKRAEAVMQYMISRGVRADMVSARGHGEADPVASNGTAEGRAQNRRVEITIAGS